MKIKVLTGLALLLLQPVHAGIWDTSYGADSLLWQAGAEFQYAMGRGEHAPFLRTANQWDRYAFGNQGLSTWLYASKEFRKSNILDWGFGFEQNLWKDNNRTAFHTGEAYLKAKLAVVNVFAGRKRSIYGNQDPELSSGGMIWSANARAMRRIGLESNDFVDVPFTKGYLELKGGMSHGWYDDSCTVRKVLLHHKYLYGRIGGKLPVKLQFGLQHVAQWGGEKNGTHPYGPVNWENFKRIVLIRSGDEAATVSDQINKLGNHILSKNLGMEIDVKNFHMNLYWQNLYEDAPVDGMFDSNSREDGLWGASFRLPRFRLLSAFTLEYVSTTDQSGPFHDLDGVIYGGADNYYNGQYPNGWSYDGMTSGNPWLTSPRYNKDGSRALLNNAIRLYYFAGKGSFKVLNKEIDYKLTLSYSKNYGKVALVMPASKNAFSGLFECRGALYRNYIDWTAGTALDRGKMYGDNTALWVGVAAHWSH